MKRTSISEEDLLINGNSSYAVRAMAEKLGFKVEDITPFFYSILHDNSVIPQSRWDGQQESDKDTTIYFGTILSNDLIPNTMHSSFSVVGMNYGTFGTIQIRTDFSTTVQTRTVIENQFFTGAVQKNVASMLGISFVGYRLAVQR